MSFGTGVWVIFSNWSLLRSSSAASDAVRGEDGMKRYLTFGNQRKYRSLCKERIKCRYMISIAQIGGNVEMAALRRRRSSPLPQKVRVLSAKAGENGMPFGKFAKERSNCL